MEVLAAIALTAAAAVAYRLSLRWWPYTRCPRCCGGGKNTGSTSRRWGNCPRCGGSGRRLRLGARFLERARPRK